VLKRRSKPTERLRLFFATDLHGSEICFRKAIAAPGFYDASLLIIGGDLSGKALIPTFPDGAGSRRAHYLGRDEQLVDQEAIERFERHVADAGYYVWHVEDPAEIDDDERRTAAFRAAVRERLQSWVELANERLTAADMYCYMAPGNDDEDFVDEVLASSSRVVNGEGRVLEVHDGLRLASCGYSNETPWKTHREEPEDELLTRLERIAPDGDGDGLILNFHVPPHGTNLDVCFALDENQKVIVKAGGPVTTFAGSTATRRFIEARQPLLALHGHIHESKGEEKIGRTQCLNPGSTYGDGMLAGCLVDLAKRDQWSIDRFLFSNG
jgi:Icc-related predicted phosphoesterase